MPSTITIRSEPETAGLMLDLLLWRKFGRRGQALLEQALEANPGLAELGPILPFGRVVTLPDLPPIRQPLARQPVSLFD